MINKCKQIYFFNLAEKLSLTFSIGKICYDSLSGEPLMGIFIEALDT